MQSSRYLISQYFKHRNTGEIVDRRMQMMKKTKGMLSYPYAGNGIFIPQQGERACDSVLLHIHPKHSLSWPELTFQNKPVLLHLTFPLFSGKDIMLHYSPRKRNAKDKRCGIVKILTQTGDLTDKVKGKNN